MTTLLRTSILLLALILHIPAQSMIAGRLNLDQKSRVIVGATVVDGTGRKAFVANVRIVGDKIVNVGKFVTRADEEIMQAPGLVVAPGFIDIHNHSESALLSDPTVVSQVSQGITTVAIGPDGGSPW